ncbi:uncharacterized protein BDZ99DRAFT_476645 [Mytilinidion resinicola]|uniref:Mid2 domain-containing protein n=1 Tax=Mytilinidion resinicola TaxID=574789 RepID=A0A6A6YNL9_9PEZI|nr:uncharacterized protein BDZ99DRAFT_476645 [Mytilinidion resinicola]KAF2810486.1 hypothetical protein BDZ99DRAFT_476645 [Mytilinidion resinicola]
MAHKELSIRRLLQLYLSTYLLSVVRAQTTTATPTISLITDAKFIGYWSPTTSGGSAWEPQYCPSDSTWYETSTWGRCCPTSVTNADCSMWTSCASTSLIFESGGGSATCGTANSVCRTATISQDSNDQKPFLYIGCGASNWTAYRTPPEAVVITRTPTAKSTGSSSIGTATTSSETSSATSTPKKNSDSKIWIAGAVLGPIFLAAVAGLLWYIWMLRKREARKRDESAAPMIAPAGTYNPGADPRASYQSAYYQQPYQQNPFGDQAYAYKSPDLQQQPIQTAPVELSSVQAPVEAPAEPMSPVERR